MGTTLGLFGLAFFIVGVIAFSAGVTWLVIKISPTKGLNRRSGKPKAEPEPEPEPEPSA